MIPEALGQGTAAGTAVRAHAPAISVLVCTYNRAARLVELLESVATQAFEGDGKDAAEIVVVDNNSTDDTSSAVAGFASVSRWPVRYLLERRQGKAYALNTGLRAARAEICLVLDDDQRMPAGYLARVLALFRDRADISFAGGRVLPVWGAPPPAWLTPACWAPLGMADYGARAFVVDATRLVCLLTFAFRKADVEEVGGFRAELGVSDGRPGSTEDAELIRRLVDAGHRGLYAPHLVLEHHAPAARLTAGYYRNWYRGHGRYLALDRDPAIERTRLKLAGIPGHMVRSAGRDLLFSLSCRLRGDAAGALRHELQLQQFLGFARQRIADSWRASATPAAG